MRYNKPPIVEAVLALHFAEALDQKLIEKFTRKVESRYPVQEEMITFSNTFDTQTGRGTQKLEKSGCRLWSQDKSSTVLFLPNTVATIKNAPYTSWEDLLAESQENFEVLTKIGSTSIAKASTRFINRIDIPVEKDGKIDLHKYFSIGLSLPENSQKLALQQFAMNCLLTHPSEGYSTVLNVAASPQHALIDRMSFLIDIDIVSADLPLQKPEQLWETISGFRKIKNDIFESCITEETRRLFS